MIVRDRDSMGQGAPGARFLRGALEEFIQGQPRLRRLHDLAAGKADILRRQRRSGLPNARLAHGYAPYIAAVASGYLAGKPIAYEGEGLEEVLRAYEKCSAESLDAELAYQASVYGKGIEICYAGRCAEPMAATLDPRRAFVVYDDTVGHAPLCAVHMGARLSEAGERIARTLTVYTGTMRYEYEVKEWEDLDLPMAAAPHPFPQVPVTEYWNNDREAGDFEGVESLIEAYDLLQSDRVNDRQQFADALLVLTGVTGLAGDPDDPRAPGQRLREDKTLALPSEGARAQWLTKAANESDADVLRKALREDIHKFSMVPDLSEDAFAGNQSGVAMRYKLFGLEQMTKVKERWFREGLRQRLRLFGGLLSLRGIAAPDADKVRILFTRGLDLE